VDLERTGRSLFLDGVKLEKEKNALLLLGFINIHPFSISQHSS